VQALFPFAWTALSDIRGSRGRIFRWNAWATCAAYALLFLPRGFWPLAAGLTAYAVFKSPLIPLANAIAFGQGRREGFGRIRVWGTFGYIVAAVLLGRLIDAVGTAAILYGGGLAFVLGGLVAQRGFADGGEGLGGRFGREFAAVMADGNFLRFLAAAFLARVAGGPFIVFFTIHLERLGISKSGAGLAWGLGAGLEVVVMLAWAPLLGRFGTRALLATGLFLGGVRWVGFALATQAWSILAIQLLHGVAFATWYLASVHFLDIAVPAALRATGQGLYAAVTFGLGGIVGNVASGALVDRVGMPRLYAAAAVLALAAWGLFVVGVRAPEGPAAAPRPARAELEGEATGRER
jgi:PPP family 3-phenylpropionic acid transporter